MMGLFLLSCIFQHICQQHFISHAHALTSALGLLVQVQPSVVTVLDTVPYNTFSLVCTAAVPASVSAVNSKQFVWRRGSVGSGTNLTADAGTTITDLNLSNATSTSVLTTNTSTPGSYTYSCDVTVSSSQSSATATVNVEGKYSVLHINQISIS